MTLSVKEQTAIARLRAKLKKQPQSAIAESIGVSPQALSNWKVVNRAIGVECHQDPRGSSTKAKATTKAVIAAKATGKRTNGAHAR